MLQDQIQLEKEMTQTSLKQYYTELNRKKQQGSFAISQSANTVIKALLKDVAEKIEDYILKYTKGEATRSTKAAKLLVKINNTDVIAFVTMKIIFNLIYKEAPIQKYYQEIGSALEAEYKMTELKKHNGYYYKTIQKDLNSRQAKAQRKRAITQGVFNKRLNFHVDSFPQTDKYHAGLILFKLFCETTKLLKISNVKTAKKCYKTVTITPELEKMLEKADNYFSVTSPFYLPMIHPPKDWVSIFEGGYISPYLSKNKLIRPRAGDSKAYYQKLNKTDLSKVFKAVNIIQATPWQINKKILDIIEILWSRGESVAGLPQREDDDIQPFPFAEHTRGEPYKPDEVEIVKKWKLQTYITHKNNVKMRSKRILTQMILNIANQFKKYEKIYFPHQLDFRGRMYPIPVLLNPQGEDLAKGLLQFAEGKKLDKNSVKWLEIHGANCFGLDKVSYKERIEWVRKNKELICDVALDPDLNREWVNADKPFQFLAFCFEYASYLNNADSFITHLPVRLDGTCNGLQHYSALLRDENAAKAVNLINGDKPSDIYAIVAQKLTDILKTVPEAPALHWLQLGINRKLTKRPVMVLPYGGTLLSCREYIQEYLTDNYSLEFIQNTFAMDKNPKNTLFQASNWLSKYMWQAIEDTVQSAIVGMDYIKNLARIVNKTKKYIEWTTPMNLIVHQEYQNRKNTEIKTELFGSIIKTNIGTYSAEISAQRQINGICPNYIHSLDSSCLMLYLIKAYEAGITSFTSVHDCYGTLAPDTELSAKLLREAFVEIYKRPLLDDLEYDLIGELDIDVKDVPKKPEQGKLNINEVLKSEYFFN